MVPVAVSHPVACYRRGLVATLVEAGFPAQESESVVAWADQPGSRAVVLPADADEACAVLDLQRRLSTLAVVVLLADPTPPAYQEVLEAGAFPAVWDAPPSAIVRVVEAAMDRQVVLPKAILPEITALWPAAEPAPPCPEEAHRLDESEVLILSRIARGDTDRQIASALRLSERTVRRRLQGIFAKVGVETRVQAGVYAALRGFDNPSSPRWRLDRLGEGPDAPAPGAEA